MKLIVTAIIPSSLADDISAKLATVFDGDFIAAARQSLTAGVMSGASVYCFSGQFSQSELDQLNSLGLVLPGIVFWVQDSVSNVILVSSRAEDIGATTPAVLLIRSAGVTFPQVISETPI